VIKYLRFREANSTLALPFRFNRTRPAYWGNAFGRIADLLQVRRGEGRLVALLTALFLVANMGGAMASPGVEAMFYARFGVNYLPVMYVALGGLTMAISLLLSVMIGRLSQRRLYLGLPLALAATLILSRLLVGMRFTWFYPVLWLWMYLLWSLQALFTWGLAGMVCDSRQAKRLFPLLGGGGILGSALGGLLTKALVGFLGAENLLLVWSAALVVSFGLVLLLTTPRDQQAGRSRWQSPPGLMDEIRKDFRFVSQSSLMRWVAAGSLLFSVLLFSLAFPFSKAVANWFTNEDLMAGFLGLFQGLTTALALIVALFLANRLYAALGFMASLLAYALIYLVGFSVLLVSATFYLLVIVRFAQMVWRLGVSDSAYQGTFNLVPEKQRDQTRAFVNGVPQQVGVILTGLILIVGQEWLRPQHLYLIGIVAAAATAWVIWKGMQAYRAALMEALQAGQPNVFFDEAAPFGGLRRDAVAVETVLAGLGRPDPRIRYVSAEILADMPMPGAVPPLVKALEDPEAGVRVAALRALARAGETEALLEVSASLDDPEADVRLAAMDALYRLAKFPRGVKTRLEACLEDPEAKVRARAAALLLQQGDHPRARSVLPPMLASTDPQVRQAALQAYASWGGAGSFERVKEFLQDPAPAVSQAAVRALAKIDPARARPWLVEALMDENGAIQELAAVLLGEMGAAALPEVLGALKNPALENGALRALIHLPVEAHAGEIRSFAREKADIARRYGMLWGGLAQHAQFSQRMDLLAGALLEAARRYAIRSIRALGLLEVPQIEPSVLTGLESPNVSLRANALEVLENMAGRELLRPIFFLWEPLPAMRVTEKNTAMPGEQLTAQPEDQDHLAVTLLELMHEPDEWICACAVLASKDVDDPRLKLALVQLAQKENPPLLAETISMILNGVAMKSLPTIPIMERILYLREVPLFAGLSPVELKQIAGISGEHYFTSGEVFARQGELGDEMFIVVSGEVEVRMRREDGTEVVITRRTPGEFVGEMSIISNQPRMASLAAVGNVRVLCVEKSHFESVLRERPEVSLALIQALVERLRDQNE
jgi:HEAT repeat protein